MAIAHSATGALLDEIGTTHEVVPPSVSDGDLMILVAAVYDTAQDITLDEPGWTLAADVSSTAGGPDQAHRVWWKIAASESGNYTCTHASSIEFFGIIVTYTGVDETTPMDAAATKVEGDVNTATHTPAAITTVTDQAWVISVITAGGGGGTTIVVPSGYNERIIDEADNTKNFAYADEGPLSIGAEQPGDWTGGNTGSDWNSATLALRPAVAPAPTGDFLPASFSQSMVRF